MLPNSGHASLINKDTDVLLDRKMLHEQVNEMTTSIFDKEVGLIMFDCTNTYSDECLSTRIISNKIQGKVYHSRSNTKTMAHVASESTQVTITRLEKVEICNVEVWETSILGIYFEMNSYKEKMKD